MVYHIIIVVRSRFIVNIKELQMGRKLANARQTHLSYNYTHQEEYENSQITIWEFMWWRYQFFTDVAYELYAIAINCDLIMDDIHTIHKDKHSEVKKL